MKAIYQKPKTETTVVAVSLLKEFSKKPEEGFIPNEAPSTEETSGNLSRRRTVWDDEEDEFDE